jgi:hypothetical protein
MQISLIYPMSPNGLNSFKSLTNPSTPLSPPNNFPTIPFFSSVVLRIIFRVVVPELEAEESLPLLEEVELADKDVPEGDFGRIGSGIK